jgi:predicted ATPase
MWRFGDFEVDTARRELRHLGAVVHLEPQAFDLLVFLIEQRDRVVSKVELLDGVWGHRFISEANLTTRVKEVRRAVGDDGRRQHTIKNERGRGYRFVADVEISGPARTRGGGQQLVGRQEELAAIEDALAHARLVTVVGPGGVGKSSLARAVAGGAATRHRDNVHLVELAALDRGEDVLSAVARAVDMVLDGARTDDAVRSIAQLDTLLVLDNCEHVAEDASALVDRLLNVPGGAASILATSQVPLGVTGEAMIEVRPLDIVQSRELFTVRARAAQRCWEGVSDDRVDRLVAALDRLPLTIEMAAARVRSMTFDDLERVILDGNGLLRVTHRTPTLRHRSLESLAAWSANLLEPHHRRIFTEFAVFAGRVTANDAGVVLAPDAPDGVALDLAGLAERSLLVADVSRGETRYSMLSTVRAVAAQWLEDSGSGPRTRARHADHIVGVLGDIDDLLRTPREADGRERLDLLVDEARAAHRWAQHHRPELAAAMSGALFHAAYSSLWNEPAEWSQALLTHEAGNDTRLAGASLMVAGAAAHRGDLVDARERCAPIAAAGTGRLRATAVELLADIALYEGDLDGAAAAAEELRRLGDQLDDRHAYAFGVVDAALARAYGGDPSGALADIAAHQLGDLAPTDAAWIAYARGDALGLLGDPAAADAFRAAIELGSTVGNRFVVSVSRVSLANEHARAGDVQQSFDDYASALGDFLRHGNQTHAVTAIRNLIGLLESTGDDRGAALLAGAVSDGRLRVSYGVEAERVGEILANVQRRVGTTRFRQWIAEGQALENDRVRVAAEIVDRHRRS